MKISVIPGFINNHTKLDNTFITDSFYGFLWSIKDLFFFDETVEIFKLVKELTDEREVLLD